MVDVAGSTYVLHSIGWPLRYLTLYTTSRVHSTPMQDAYMEDIEPPASSSMMDDELGTGSSNNIINYSFANNLQTAIAQEFGAFSPSPFAQDPSASNVVGISLTKEEQESTMQTVLDVFELDERDPADGDEELDPEEEAEDQRLRTEKLKAIGSALDALWWSNNDQMAAAAEKLANGSRDRKYGIL